MSAWRATSSRQRSRSPLALSDERPAGCVAEEVLAVALLQETRVWLEMELDTGELDRTTMDAAAGELRGLFELFQDDDVLDMSEMREPSDAAASRFSPRALQMGIADQTVERWFDPFGWTAPTGYLAEKAAPGQPLTSSESVAPRLKSTRQSSATAGSTPSCRSRSSPA